MRSEIERGKRTNIFPASTSCLTPSCVLYHHSVQAVWEFAEAPALGGFPGGTVVKNPPASGGDARDLGSIPGLESPLEEEMATWQPMTVLLPGESHGQ